MRDRGDIVRWLRARSIVFSSLAEVMLDKELCPLDVVVRVLRGFQRESEEVVSSLRELEKERS